MNGLVYKEGIIYIKRKVKNRECECVWYSFVWLCVAWFGLL